MFILVYNYYSYLPIMFSVTCQKDRAFQCYDGTCIPREKLCDGVPDCPGLYHEDESDICITTGEKHTCLDWRKAGYLTNGWYTMNPDNIGKCHFVIIGVM